MRRQHRHSVGGRRALRRFNATGKSFYLFDTFCGIPDDETADRESAARRRKLNEQLYTECFEVARRNFAPYPRARLVRGRVPDTLSTVAISRVCYLSIDMNDAAPEAAALRWFWSAGAPVILDDYAWHNHEAQKKALDEFAASQGVEILTLPTGQGLIVKPPD